MISFLLRWGAALFLAVGTLVAQTDEPPIIAKARAYLGSEAALNAVQTLRYTGVLTAPDSVDPSKTAKAQMVILFQKPDRQLIRVISDKSTEATGLDGYDGWQRVQDPKEPAKWRQTVLGPDQVKRLRANTWENLFFFRGIEKVGGKMEVQETKTIEGVSCQKVAFIHTPNVIFYRYFDVATGRLVLTETEAGGTIREEGESVVAGIRFPKKLITSSKNAKGEVQTVTIDFDQISVNDAVPASEFAVPSLTTR
jgi:hypothetical protein